MSRAGYFYAIEWGDRKWIVPPDEFEELVKSLPPVDIAIDVPQICLFA